MDFDTNEKKFGEAIDHSFVKKDEFGRKIDGQIGGADDLINQELDSLAGFNKPIKSNSNDDFEYVGAPSLTNEPEIDLLGGLASKPAVDLLGDFHTQDHFSHKAATMDFMAAERQIAASHSPTKSVAAPVEAKIDEPHIEKDDDDDDDDDLVPAKATLKNSIYDDFENDYLKPMPHDTISNEAANEKFISSEDLLGDFDQPKEIAPPVPKHAASAVVEDIFLASDDDKSSSFQSPVHVDPVVDIKPVAPVKPLPAEPIPEVKPTPPPVAVREVTPPSTATTKAPKDAPPQPPVRKNDTKILADEIFSKIGLGKFQFLYV